MYENSEKEANVSNITLRKIMEGCFLAKTGDDSILLGSPSEIVKVLKLKGETLPDKIVLPEKAYVAGVIQSDVEFPFFESVFVLGRYFKGQRLKIFGDEQQLTEIGTLLNLALFGPSDERQQAWGIPEEEISEQRKISDELAMKKSDGTIVPLDEMVEFIRFDENRKTNAGCFTVENKGSNLFEISVGAEMIAVDLNFYEKQPPPLPINVDAHFQLERPAFGLLSLSECTSGFDPLGYTTGLVLFANSMPIAIDGVPWQKDHLRAMGLNPSEFVGMIISHVHGDHATVIDFIINGQKVNLITIRSIYMSFMEKIALTIRWPVEKVESMLIFTEVFPGLPFNWYGATFTFFRTVHVVPCIGFEAEMHGKKIVYSGDTVWGKRLNDLSMKGVITLTRQSSVTIIPFIRSDVTIMDGSGGLIHPDPLELNSELSETQKKRTFLTHKSSLPEEVTNLRTLQPGMQWVLIPSKKIDLGDYSAITHAPIFSGLDRKWMSAIISQGKIISVTPGKTILRAGRPGKDFYVVLSGTFDVLNEEGDLLTQLGNGDFFGEISIMQKISCTATIRAATRGKLLALSPEIFLTLINTTGRSEKLRKIHQIRPILFKCGLTRELPPATVNKLVEKITRKMFRNGDIVIRQGEVGEEMYFIEEGQVRVFIEPNGSEAKDIAHLYRHQFFGEMALLGNGIRTATVVAEKDTIVLAINKRDFAEISAEVPLFVYYFGLMAEERINSM